MDRDPQGRATGSGGQGHRLIIENREQVTITGVLHVESFDEREIVLDTDLGTLTLQGQDLQIKQLDLDAGTFSVEGLVTSLQYATGQKAREQAKGLIGRLFR
jgi:sporulation protein YabP